MTVCLLLKFLLAHCKNKNLSFDWELEMSWTREGPNLCSIIQGVGAPTPEPMCNTLPEADVHKPIQPLAISALHHISNRFQLHLQACPFPEQLLGGTQNTCTHCSSMMQFCYSTCSLCWTVCPLFLQLGRVDTNQGIYGDVKYLLTTLPGNNGDHGSSLCEKQEC